jgi:hypothetical protein
VSILSWGNTPVWEVIKFPLVVSWPGDAPVVSRIEGQRRVNGRIEVIYRDRDELAEAVRLMLDAERLELESRMTRGLDLMRQAADEDTRKRLISTWEQVTGRYSQICELSSRLCS